MGDRARCAPCVFFRSFCRDCRCVRKVPRGEISAAVPPLSVAAVPRVALMGEVGEYIWRVIALMSEFSIPADQVMKMT